MKLELTIKKEFDVKYLAVTAGIRYAEDVSVDGERLEEDSDLSQIPCHDGEYWQVIIDVDNGIIANWPKGQSVDVYAKVRDDGTYSILDKNKQVIKTLDQSYVPDCLAIEDSGYGDYIIMKIDANGKIQNWKPSFDEFQIDEDC